MSEYQLGSTITYLDREWRIVRIVTTDRSLFEDASGVFVLQETYLMIKDAVGTIDFVLLDGEKLPYTGEPSPIKGLDPMVWRKHE